MGYLVFSVCQPWGCRHQHCINFWNFNASSFLITQFQRESWTLGVQMTLWVNIILRLQYISFILLHFRFFNHMFYFFLSRSGCIHTLQIRLRHPADWHGTKRRQRWDVSRFFDMEETRVFMRDDESSAPVLPISR